MCGYDVGIARQSSDRLSKGCSMALDVWACVGMVWAARQSSDRRLHGPVGVD